jgi:hypothetical protein
MIKNRRFFYALILFGVIFLLFYLVFARFNRVAVTPSALIEEPVIDLEKSGNLLGESAVMTENLTPYNADETNVVIEPVAPILEVFDQQVSADRLFISKVVVANNSVIEIYEDNFGQPGKLLGAREFFPGTFYDVEIRFSDLPETTLLLAVMHDQIGTKDVIEGNPGTYYILGERRSIVPFSLIQTER